MVNWIVEHWKDVLAIIGAAVTLASGIVKLTPTQKDDTVLARIINVLVMLSIYNKDGSVDGKAPEAKK